MDLKLTKITGPTRSVMLRVIKESGTRQSEKGNPCKKACSSCCYRLVSITLSEALVIFSNLSKHGNWESVKKTAVSQKEIVGKLSKTAWMKMKKPCPVLDEKTGMCLSYNVRPPICSAHFVSSHPKSCDPWYVGSIKYEPDHMEHEYRAAMDEIHEYSNELLSISLPMPLALLMAESISVKQDLSFEEAMRFISNA